MVFERAGGGVGRVVWNPLFPFAFMISFINNLAIPLQCPVLLGGHIPCGISRYLVTEWKSTECNRDVFFP